MPVEKFFNFRPEGSRIADRRSGDRSIPPGDLVGADDESERSLCFVVNLTVLHHAGRDVRWKVIALQEFVDQRSPIWSLIQVVGADRLLVGNTPLIDIGVHKEPIGPVPIARNVGANCAVPAGQFACLIAQSPLPGRAIVLGRCPQGLGSPGTCSPGAHEHTTAFITLPTGNQTTAEAPSGIPGLLLPA